MREQAAQPDDETLLRPRLNRRLRAEYIAGAGEGVAQADRAADDGRGERPQAELIR
jgi:hypothetical protein